MKVLKSLVFDDMVEFEIGLATDWTPGVGGHGAVACFLVTPMAIRRN